MEWNSMANPPDSGEWVVGLYHGGEVYIMRRVGDEFQTGDGLLPGEPDFWMYVPEDYEMEHE